MTIHKFRGMTILETMLVLAIAAAIILMAFKQFQMYRKDNYYAILKYDVDILFQGLNQYYQANCASPGPLWPSNSTYDVVPLNVVSLDPPPTVVPYLPGQWPLNSPVVFNPGTGSTSSSFYAQYNPMTKVEKNEYVCFNFPTPPAPPPGAVSCSAPKQIGKTIVVMWQSQVAVKMADPKDAIYYAGIVGATCAADDPTVAVDCTKNQDLKEAQYLVWQRLPSFPSADVVSQHWVANPVSKLFNLQYTNDPMYELYTQDVPTPSSNNSVYYRNYLCGG